MWLKWLAIVLGVLAVALIGLRVMSTLVTNPRVIEELNENPEGERAGIVMLLTFPDGRALPVNYLREGNLVFTGADGRWWRALRAGNVPVTLLIRGETLTGRVWSLTTRNSNAMSSCACGPMFPSDFRNGWMRTW